MKQLLSQTQWTSKDSVELYGINRWGLDYFDIADNGDVVVNANLENGESHQVSLKHISEGLQQRGLDMPIMLRLDNLVDKRIDELNLGFQKAIDELDYQGKYQGVFPIKVNQQSQVIKEIVKYGEKYDYGLEAGSKAELLIAISTLKNRKSLIICNGYKDAEFIDLGLQAIRLGFKCFFVMETPKELQLILERSEFWGVNPLLGMRLKLSTKVDGQWTNDSGDRSLFGLTTNQIINVIDDLKAVGKIDCLKLLHYHLGSQIPNIRNIRDGIREATRYYINMVDEGVKLEYIDLGGGLAVDYDGTGNGDFSRNYSVEEYCIDIIEGLKESLDRFEIPHPIVITESGRATVAPMSVLLFNIIDVNTFEPQEVKIESEDHHESITSLLETIEGIDLKNLQESYNDALYYRDQTQEAFRRGLITLRERAIGENLYLSILQKVLSLVPQLKYPSDDLQTLDYKLADIYYGNFSVFQSLPDAWAIGQIFPVIPIHRLDTKPTRQAVIADLTCDCDGKLDNFCGMGSNEKTLPLHHKEPSEEYILGVFLVGAYQETLGDLHNLFGDTNVASVRIAENGIIEYVNEIEGDSISDVLSYVEYEPQDLYKSFRSTAELAVSENRISIQERQTMLKLFKESLTGYTYFEQ